MAAQVLDCRLATAGVVAPAVMAVALVQVLARTIQAGLREAAGAVVEAAVAVAAQVATTSDRR